MAERASEGPAMRVEGVGGGEGHATETHEQVSGRQVPDEEVGGVVQFPVDNDAHQQEGIAHAGHEHHDGVERHEEWLEAQQELCPREHVQQVRLVGGGKPQHAVGVSGPGVHYHQA